VVHAHFHARDLDAVTRELVQQGAVRARHGGRRVLTLGRPWLIARDGKGEASLGESAQPRDHARQEPKVIGVESHRDGAGFVVTHDVDQRAVTIQNDAGAQGWFRQSTATLPLCRRLVELTRTSARRHRGERTTVRDQPAEDAECRQRTQHCSDQS